jgi:hypothetical protein
MTTTKPVQMVCIGVMLASPAAPYLPHGGALNALIHFHGGEASHASACLSACLYAGASVWGAGLAVHCSESFVNSWCMTPAAAELVFGQHDNIGIVLDDADRMSSRDLKKIAQVFGGGESARLKGPSWSLFGISKGAAPIATPCVVNIPFSDDALAAAHTDARTFAEALTRGARSHYGHAGPIFVQWLLNHESEARDRLKALFLTEIDLAPRGGLLRPIAACATLAADAHILPWGANVMMQAFAEVANRRVSP